MRSKGWIAVMVSAALAGAGWWTLREAAPPDHFAAADAAEAAASRALERLPKSAPMPSLPAEPVLPAPVADLMKNLDAQQANGPSADFVAKRAALERRAGEGDAQAEADLGELLLSCDGYVDFADTDVDTLLVEGIALLGKDAMQLPDSVPIDAVADAAKRDMARMRDTCAGSQGLALSRNERLDAYEKLRRGARAGIPAAMRNFAHFPFEDFADTRSMLAHPERVRERRREARSYLERAIAAGDVEALAVAADAHHSGSFVEKSNEMAYANMVAYQRAHVADGHSYDADLALYGDGLTPEQKSRAQARGEAIFQACCATKPGGAR